MDWKHGYFAEGGYTYGIYSETLPTRLRWASLMQGHLSPAKEFRYLDAGCGQGYGLVAAATAHPDSEFVGIDFLPEHIAHGRKLAAAAGLKNIEFIEADFKELASNWTQHHALKNGFDYAVCHGITTWIDPKVRDGLFSLLGQSLRSGGVFYNSYNTKPGWLAMTPFQHLVLLESRRNPGKPALEAARNYVEELAKLSETLPKSLPGMGKRLEQMKAQDAAYLVQEYNNQHWNPVFVTEMMDLLAPNKLTYLGTATLPDLFDGTLSKPLKEWISRIDDLKMKEQLRDLALNQSFRRDIYVKGRIAPWRHQPWHLDDEQLVFIRNDATARPVEGEPYVIKGGASEIKASPAFYSAVLAAVERGGLEGVRPDSVVQSIETRQRSMVPQALSLLLHGGWIHLRTAACSNGSATNKALSRMATQGAPYRYLLLSAVDAVQAVGDTEWMLVEALTHAVPRNDWAQHVLTGLKKMNKQLASQGQAITDPKKALENVQSLIAEFEANRLPQYRALGAL